MNQRAFGRSLFASGQWSFLATINDPSVVGEFNFKGIQAEIILDNYEHLVDMHI